MALADRARRADAEARVLLRRRGAPLKVAVPRGEAEAQEAQVMAASDLWEWLLSEIRQALDLLSPEGYLTTATEARPTVQTAAELLLTLQHPDITAFAQHLLASHDPIFVTLLSPKYLRVMSYPPWFCERTSSAAEGD
jgi:hypothetical protein